MASNQTMEDAIKAYKIKHYDESFKIFKKWAKKDDPDALFYLGLSYYDGHGVDKDSDKAYMYFRQAREGLQEDAFAYLGHCHELGFGTDVNKNKAYQLYATAAEHHSTEGLLNQARCLEKGIGTAKNRSKALKKYVQLAKEDNAYAMYRIGRAYLTGEGIKKSLESAYKWLNRALVNGSVDAMNYLRFINVKNDKDGRSPQDMLATAKELYQNKSYEQAHIYFEIAAKENLPEAMLYLSEMYNQGLGVEQDKERSIACLNHAKDDLPEAWMELADRYMKGDGIPSSYVKAYAYYEKALANGIDEAQARLDELRGYRRE